MVNVFNFNGLSNRELHDIALGKTSIENILHASEARKEAAKALLQRRTMDASFYQNLFLEAWLDRLHMTNRLPLIENDNDRKELLSLLFAALNDSLSLPAHKVRCCLVINKLLAENNMNHILEKIISDDAASNIHQDKLNVFGPFLETNRLMEIVDALEAKLDHPESTQEDKNDAIVALGAIAPYMSSARCRQMILVLMPRFLGQNVAEIELASTAIQAIVVRGSSSQVETPLLPMLRLMRGRALGQRQAALAMRQQLPQMNVDEMIRINLVLMNDPNPNNRIAAARVLSLIAPLGSQPRRDQVMACFLMKLPDRQKELAISAARGLSRLVPHASPDERNAIIDGLVQATKRYRPKVAYRAAVTALGVIARNDFVIRLDPIIEAIVKSLDTGGMSQIDYAAEMERYNAVRDLAAIVPRASLAQCGLILQSLMGTLNSKYETIFVRHAVVRVLGEMAPFLPQALYDQMINPNNDDQLCALVHTLEEESQDIGYIGNHAVILLAAMAPRASQAQCDQMLGQLVSLLSKEDNLNADENELLVMAVIFALQAIRPYVSDNKRMVMINVLRDEMDSDECKIAAWALGAPLSAALEALRSQLVGVLLLELREATYQPDRQAVVTMIGAFIPVLTDAELKHIVDMPGELSYEQMALQLMAQTRLHAKAELSNEQAPRQGNGPI